MLNLNFEKSLRNCVLNTWYRCEINNGGDDGAKSNEDGQTEEHVSSQRRCASRTLGKVFKCIFNLGSSARGDRAGS